MEDTQTTRGHGGLSVEEAAIVAEVSRQTVHYWIAQGRLQPLRTDDGDRLDPEALLQFLALRRAATAVGITVDTLLQWTEEARETA
jgi:DNA-binding transcriptional MerR regulator